VTTKNLTPKNPDSTKPNNPASTGNNGDGDKNKNVNPEELRRLVIVCGDKGGVGKSTAARGIAQIYLDNAVAFVGLDADNSNPHLIRFYRESANILPLDISNSDSLS
jgi:Mrp family chromosome partitioning ATPase